MADDPHKRHWLRWTLLTLVVLGVLGAAFGDSTNGGGNSTNGGGNSDAYTCRRVRIGNETIYVTKDKYGNERTFDSALDCY